MGTLCRVSAFLVENGVAGWTPIVFREEVVQEARAEFDNELSRGPCQPELLGRDRSQKPSGTLELFGKKGLRNHAQLGNP